MQTREQRRAKFFTPASLLADGYKIPHIDMYPDDMTTLFTTWTPRSDKIARQAGRQLSFQAPKIVAFGLSAVMSRINNEFEVWFARDEDEVVKEYVDFVFKYQGVKVTGDHWRKLHKLGRLPVTVLGLPEGTVTKTGVVHMVAFNHTGMNDFGWLVNYIESLFSTEQWKMQTSATIAHNYHQLLTNYARLTCDNDDHVQWQAHDFSMRGLSGVADSESSAIGHLLYFNGTDVIPALFAADNLYANFDIASKGGVPATEHSVMCAGGKHTEIETIRRLLRKYPTGILSVVCDTWDYWHVLTVILPQLKDEIMARDGKLVIRPDSGDPVKIICGDRDAAFDSPAYHGSIELLARVFGYTVNSKGFRELDSHIGLIYGDSITLERAELILSGLQRNGYASNNVVLGIGSYTYQATTRDVWGFAMKATGAIIAGEELPMFKDPVTDDGTKKSFKGFLTTRLINGEFVTVDGMSFAEAQDLSNSAFVYYPWDDQEREDAGLNDWQVIAWRAKTAAMGAQALAA